VRIFSRFSMIVIGFGLCAALTGCQKQSTDQMKPKTDTGKTESGGSAGAKVDAALEKTKEKAQEVSSTTKEKAQELTNKVKEKTQDAGAGTTKSK